MEDLSTSAYLEKLDKEAGKLPKAGTPTTTIEDLQDYIRDHSSPSILRKQHQQVAATVEAQKTGTLILEDASKPVHEIHEETSKPKDPLQKELDDTHHPNNLPQQQKNINPRHPAEPSLDDRDL